MNTRRLAAKVNKAAFAVISFLLMTSSHHAALDRGLQEASGSVSVKAASKIPDCSLTHSGTVGMHCVFLRVYGTQCDDAAWDLCNAHKNTAWKLEEMYRSSASKDLKKLESLLTSIATFMWLNPKQNLIWVFQILWFLFNPSFVLYYLQLSDKSGSSQLWCISFPLTLLDYLKTHQIYNKTWRGFDLMHSNICSRHPDTHPHMYTIACQHCREEERGVLVCQCHT